MDDEQPQDQKEKSCAKKEKVDNREMLSEEETFEKFWEHYGKKVGKKKSFKQWQKIPLEKQREAYKFVTAYKKVRPIKQYRKDPERFLRDRIWESDEHILEQYAEMQKTGSQAVTNQVQMPYQPRKDTNETVLDAKLAIQELSENQQLEVEKMMQDYENSVKNTDEWFMMGNQKKRQKLAEKATEFVRQIQTQQTGIQVISV